MFEGTFIGNGAEISNLSINSDSNNVGFFGAVNNANISGLRFADSKLNVTGQRAAAAIGAAVIPMFQTLLLMIRVPFQELRTMPAVLSELLGEFLYQNVSIKLMYLADLS